MERKDEGSTVERKDEGSTVDTVQSTSLPSQVSPNRPSKLMFFARKALHDRQSASDYDEYLMAMKRVRRYRSDKRESREGQHEIASPRERYRRQSQKRESIDVKVHSSAQETIRLGVIASMVPDEIICGCQDYSIRTYETALMFIDITGFTNLCERYTTSAGRGGPSKLTQVLNTYIGAMVQEILTHNGDVLKFSGDAFLSMWKKTPQLTMQDIVHNAIDCGLIIQKNYGTFDTDAGVILKVKVAISAGRSYFAIIGGENQTQSNYVIVGQPVWDVKMAQYMTTAGDVLTSASALKYVNEAEYCTQPCGDGRHTKVLGVGQSWKRVERLSVNECKESDASRCGKGWTPNIPNELQNKEFSLRPAVMSALRNESLPALRRFMPTPVLLAVDNDETMDFLTEIRHVVVVFLNIITRTVTTDVLLNVVNNAYKCVLSVTSKSHGYVNKVSMFDKDMMFLIVFGLRGLKHESEAENAILCANELMEKLVDESILSVSIGVTSGITYCGVVGHCLRREYTVIGPAVNKAARLMVAYHDMVSCDKETFLRSKLAQEYFRQLEPKPLKGIAKPGPLYQFSKVGWIERVPGWRHPILDRSEELKRFKLILQNALEQQYRTFTRYRDHKYAVAYTGQKSVGTTRLLEESLALVPDTIFKKKIVLRETEVTSYFVIRCMMAVRCKRTSTTTDMHYARNIREENELMLRNCLYSMETTPAQLHAINVIFNCRFPLPDNFQPSGDMLSDLSVKSVIREICIKNFASLNVIGIDNAQFIDDESWRILLILLDTQMIFIIMAISNADSISLVAQNSLKNHMIVTIPLKGISRSYHAALACQLLDVQAIPADLEKVIESASEGLPGWIQNFVISLVQREALSIVTLSRTEARALGAITPSPALLQKTPDIQHSDDPLVKGGSSLTTMTYSRSGSTMSANKLDECGQEIIQMAVLPEAYSFDNMNVDITMDSIILKIYDSLNPFEKMLLKCGSVLGDVFPRRMLLHLLQSNSPRKFAEAVAKLFSIRVLECEGGDFTRDTSLVLVHPAPALHDPKPPYCACLGTRRLPYCRNLPMYAFCGYMKFRHTLFRTTTYELLTEIQKGLVEENEALKRIRRQICELSAEAKILGEDDTNSEYSVGSLPGDMSYQLLETDGTLISRILGRGESLDPKLEKQYQEIKRVRSFSSLDLENCECLSILQHVYSQLIDHCKGAGAYEKLFQAYLEYADLCINIDVNIPQGFRLLSEVEEYIKVGKFCGTDESLTKWVHDFHLASVMSLRGVCMLEAGDPIEARKQLFRALELYCVPFPTSKYGRSMHNMSQSLRQLMALYVAPQLYIGGYSGTIGHFYDDIATTLSRLYMLFTECKEEANATLAAKWSLNYALRSNSNLRVLCTSYAHMISVYTQKQKYSMCTKLENRAIENCRRKRGQLDVTEVESVCFLYTSIFLFYVEWSKKIESLEFGLAVMHMMPSVHSAQTRQVLVLWMLKLLLCDQRIEDMVAIMREFLYLTDTTDLCSQCWYYYYALVILLDTGYCVESIESCENFYIKKGDALLRSKTVEASWNFFVAMWLVTIRIGAWERSTLWEDKILQLVGKKYEKNEYNAMMFSKLIEGLLIMLVNEMDNRNVKKIIVIQKALKPLFQAMNQSCVQASLYRPKYYLMLAYYNYINGNKHKAYNNLNKARDFAKQYSHSIELIWIEHTRNHWRGSLNPRFKNYWCEHVEPDNLLDYRDFNIQKGRSIIPYTLPVPMALDK